MGAWTNFLTTGWMDRGQPNKQLNPLGTGGHLFCASSRM
jgi:hypothetical protein